MGGISPYGISPFEIWSFNLIHGTDFKLVEQTLTWSTLKYDRHAKYFINYFDQTVGDRYGTYTQSVETVTWFECDIAMVMLYGDSDAFKRAGIAPSDPDNPSPDDKPKSSNTPQWLKDLHKTMYIYLAILWVWKWRGKTTRKSQHRSLFKWV